MALGDPYATLGELKDYLKIPLTKQQYDEALQDALESASAEIDRSCNRQFNKADTATERLFYPTSCDFAYIDDFCSTTGLVIVNDGVTLTTSQYELHPLNGVVDNQLGWPYYKIKLKFGNYFLNPLNEAILRVTAQWGWTEVPTPIHQACLIMAAETFQLKDAPFGVAGMDVFGNPFRVRDNRIAGSKLARYARRKGLVG